MVGFAPVTDLMTKVYNDVSDIQVTLLTLVFIVMFIPINFPANKMIDKNLRPPVIIASVLLLAGCWVRMLVGTDGNGFHWILVGQCLSGLSQPFMLCGPARVAKVWFGENENAIATTLGALAVPLGCLTGMVVPSFFIPPLEQVDPTEELDDLTKQEYVKKIYNYLLWQNIIITVLAVPILFFVKNAPKSPPSKDASKAPVQSNCWKDTKKLFTNWNFLILSLSFSFLYGVYMTLGAVVGLISA